MSKKVLLLIIILIFLIAILLIINLFANKQGTKQSPTPVISAPTPSPVVFPSASISRQGVGIETPQYKQAEEKYIQNSPILQKLPFNETFFSIDYINEQHLVIHAKTADKERDYQAARNWFVENGISIDKITIEYK